MYENEITVKIDFVVEGEIGGYSVTAKESYIKWYDMNNILESESITEKLFKVMRKLDKVDMITIRVLNGDYCNPYIYNSYRYVKDYNRYRKMQYDTETYKKTNNNSYQEIEWIEGEKQEQKFKKDLKKCIVDQLTLTEKIHVEKLHEMLKEKAI